MYVDENNENSRQKKCQSFSFDRRVRFTVPMRGS